VRVGMRVEGGGDLLALEGRAARLSSEEQAALDKLPGLDAAAARTKQRVMLRPAPHTLDPEP